MNNVISTFFVLLNPLTPMPAVTTVLHCSTSDATTIDKKLHGVTYTQILQEERIFPLIPRPERLAQLRLKYARKCSEFWNTGSKSFLNYFLGNYLTGGKLRRRSTNTAKGKEKEKKERQRKKWKELGHFFYFCACPSKNVINTMLAERKSCLYVANAFLNRLELMWLISRLEMSKMSKKWVFAKKL